MAVEAQSHTETSLDRDSSKELEALRAILATQGEAVSYEEAADIGNELLSFFEAFGEGNEITEDSHA
jgi:hypothetical protein